MEAFFFQLNVFRIIKKRNHVNCQMNATRMLQQQQVKAYEKDWHDLNCNFFFKFQNLQKNVKREKKGFVISLFLLDCGWMRNSIQWENFNFPFNENKHGNFFYQIRIILRLHQWFSTFFAPRTLKSQKNFLEPLNNQSVLMMNPEYL